MEITRTKLGIYIIKTDLFFDERGVFSEIYNQDKYFGTEINHFFVQDNLSISKYGVVRGLHFQKSPKAQGKLIQVVKGEIFDVAVNIDKKSCDFGKHETFFLTRGTQVFIPDNFAHGFQSLQDDSIITYKCTNTYSKQHESTIMWNDPEINIKWPIKNAIISEKDSQTAISLSKI